MKFILLNMSYQFTWDKGIYNRNKHVLDELSKREDVEQILSVDFLPYDFRSFLRLYLKSKIYRKIGKNVVAMGHYYVARRLSDKVIALSAMNAGRVYKAASKLGFKDAIILNYNPLNTDYLKLFKNNKKYFDAVDNWSNNSIFKKYKNLLDRNYKKIVTNSNHVFTVSDKLKDDLEKISYCIQKTDTAMVCVNVKNDITFISNGVDLSHYKNPVLSERLEKNIKEIRKNYKKIVGYIGVIKTDRIDIDLLEFIVKNNPNFLFLIAGPIHGNFDIAKFKKYSNINFIGEIKYEEMPYLYEQFDVCIIPHLVNDFIKSMDPKKLYEYLASGKPIVTTEVSGVEKFKNYIKVVKNKEDFSTEINNIINDPESFKEDKIQERRLLVNEYGWEKKVDEMLKFML